jgi:hypothetical protein
MFESFKESLTTWHTRNSDRAKMQQTYIALAIVLLLAAGVIGLLNHELGQNILAVAIVCAGMFLVNAVVWSLLQSAVLSRISLRRAASNRKK